MNYDATVVSLVFLRGDRQGEVFPLVEFPVTIGSDEACSITLKNSNVPRRHAIIRKRDGMFFVASLSPVGVVVDGETIAGVTEVELRHGTEIEALNTVFQFVDPKDSHAAGKIEYRRSKVPQSKLPLALVILLFVAGIGCILFSVVQFGDLRGGVREDVAVRLNQLLRQPTHTPEQLESAMSLLSQLEKSGASEIALRKHELAAAVLIAGHRARAQRDRALLEVVVRSAGTLGIHEAYLAARLKAPLDSSSFIVPAEGLGEGRNPLVPGMVYLSSREIETCVARRLSKERLAAS